MHLSKTHLTQTLFYIKMLVVYVNKKPFFIYTITFQLVYQFINI